MKQNQKEIRFKIRARAAQIAQSLLTEGYRIISQSNACEIITLRHWRNGNHITIVCGQIGVNVYKNGLLKKIELL